jgi:thiopurine S-methyltransferase
MHNRADWISRWSEGRTGFHQADINPKLVAEWPGLVPDAACTVLVPLCGKSSDMCWLLERGHRVIGVEFSAMACRSFFDENELEYGQRTVHGFTIFEAKNSKVQLWCGDFFKLRPAMLGPIEAVYDRAAIVALPQNLWSAYAVQLDMLLSGGAVGLMLTFHYPQAEHLGPPFSVSFEHVETTFSGAFVASLLSSADRSDENYWGLTWLFEPVIKLSRP